ncbi:LacI family DNA-binding transcriptional regulator [Empedobacter brevis]|uniref:LacI family DNA-binding transcriptional regulator n=1 Tax=Empedobacter brevis TaxID=247 RepID=UPI0039B0F29F
MKRTTIKDLSKYLSLSTSTISRALLDHKDIKDSTKKRVLDAAKKLKYKPDSTAISLRYGKTKSIGLVVPEMLTPFSANILKGIQKVTEQKNYKVIILQSDENSEREKENLLLLESFKVDGIIINICDQNANSELYQEIISRGTPMVFIDRIPNKNLDVSKIIVDDNNKSALMVEYLVGKGYCKIAHIMGPNTIKNSRDRADGYTRIMSKHKLFDPELIVEAKGLSFKDGRDAIEQLKKKDIKFDAVFAFTDTLAIGAMNYLHEHNIAIPSQVAIASFSGTELSQHVFPQISSVEQPLDLMGESAATHILEKINDNTLPNETIVLSANIVYRGSTP